MAGFDFGPLMGAAASQAFGLNINQDAVMFSDMMKQKLEEKYTELYAKHSLECLKCNDPSGKLSCRTGDLLYAKALGSVKK